ncbi:CaiB/BaiF CoA transferase family protein [Chloroflexota bacterium]
MKQVFEGIKVADFSWSVAGPIVTKCLADHGAFVVRIESTRHLDVTRTTRPYKDNKPGINRAGFYAAYNDNKYGIALDMSHSKGLEVARRIVAWADIVAESYIPGTMERWGLSYDELCKINPSVIMFSTTNQGQNGPRAHQRGFGYHLTSLAGFVDLAGWPDRGPSMISVAYTDIVSHHFAVTALVAALDYRRRTGKGQHIDISQYEASLQFLAPLLLDITVNNHVTDRMGNRNESAAPHGVYPCKGEDRWCAIAMLTDRQWDSFCQAIGSPEWSKGDKFSTLSARKKNEDELDSLIADWTMNFTAEEVMSMMQDRDIPSGVVSNCRDIHQNRQLQDRRHFVPLKHPEIERYYFESPPFVLSKTPAEIKTPSPCLGEHNEYFYTKVLGMSDDEFVQLVAEGVFE